MIWDEAHLKALLQLAHSPLHLIQVPPWDAWIQQHGGLKAVSSYLLNLEELAEDQRQLLRVILEHPQQAAEFYAAACHISRKTYFRVLGKLLPVLEHRLNDWQSRPALISPRAPAYNLPAALTSFVGREKEIATIKQLLANSRLITLTGPGGIGKTRLALQVAPDLRDVFSDGVWFVELAPLSDPNLVPQAVATTLGIRETAGRPLTETLSDYLRTKKDSLLLLDNCEHLIEACAKLADSLLQACPGLHLLASSREGLGIAGEISFPVPSLTLPDPEKLLLAVEGLTHFEAVQLFVERARTALPGFEVTAGNAPAIAQICRQLDGIPLALELAAARVKIMSVEQIAARLGDRFHLLAVGSRTAPRRQQTLRAAIDWSYDLLSELERALLQRLSVFVGGWTLEAAELVTGSWQLAASNQSPTASCQLLAANDVLELLTQLINKSLVVVEWEPGPEVRYRLLETIRLYAREKLVKVEAALVRNRHLEFFLNLAETIEPKLYGAEQRAGLEQLESDHNNLRAALAWSLSENAQAEAGLRFVAALWFFWYLRGYWTEGREWAQKILSLEVTDPSALYLLSQAKALGGAGWLAGVQGDAKQAIELSEKSLTLFKERGPAGKPGAAFALRTLGYISRNVPQLEESLALFQESGDRWGMAEVLSLLALNTEDTQQALALNQQSLSIRRAIGNNDGMAWSLFQIGVIASLQGGYERAGVLFEESLSLFQKVSNKHGMVWVYREWGYLAWFQRDYERATRLLTESQTLFGELGDRWGYNETLIFLGLVAHAQGDSVRGSRLLEESLTFFRGLENKWNTAWTLRYLGSVRFAQKNVDQAVTAYKESLRLYQGFGMPANRYVLSGIIFCLVGLAAAASLHGQAKRAVHLLGAARAYLEGLETRGFLLWLPDRAHYAQTVAAVCAEWNWDDVAFSAQGEAGRAMTLEQVIAYALEESAGDG